MKVFMIERKFGDYTYGDNYRAVVVAENALKAERLARLRVGGWKDAKLRVPYEVDLGQEQVLSIENMGG